LPREGGLEEELVKIIFVGDRKKGIVKNSMKEI
jgi:hypothetical protein